MKELIWKIRFALRIRQRSKMPYKFCWQCAEANIDNSGDWRDESPIDTADEELSCWGE